MIIRAILSAIKTAFDAIIHAVAWLLVAFGLWVPLTYTLLFIVVCALGRMEISKLSTVYFVGLFLSFVGSLWVSISYNNLRREREDNSKSKVNRSNMSDLKRKEHASAGDRVAVDGELPMQQQPAPTVNQTPIKQQPAPTVNQIPAQETQPQSSAIMDSIRNDPRYAYPLTQPSEQVISSSSSTINGFASYVNPNAYAQCCQPVQPTNQVPPPYYGQVQQPYVQPFYGQPYYAQTPQYMQPNMQQTMQSPNNGTVNYPMHNSTRGNYGEENGNAFQGYINPSNPHTQSVDEQPPMESYAEISEPPRYRDPAARQSNDKYKVFASRKDPTILIYEYDDRLDYYRKSPNGPQFVRSERK